MGTKSTTKEKIDKIEDPVIQRELRNYQGGAKSNMNNYRNSKNILETHVDRVFQGDISLNPETKETNVLKGHLIRTVMEIAMQSITPPIANIEPVNASKTGYEDKTKASMTEALLQWFLRFAGFEEVFNEGLIEFTGYGDMNLRPFVRPTNKEGVVYPGIEDIKSSNLIIDPNATYITSESSSKQAQFIGHVQHYPEANLVSRFGKWILDYVEPGQILDDSREFQNKPGVEQLKYYEVLELQNKSTGVELLLVGSTAFPVVRRVEGEKTPEIPKELEGKVVWTNKYLYKNSFGENILTIGNLYYYYDPRRPYNNGLADKLVPVQIMSEINSNLQTDNVIKRMDGITYVIGADDRTDIAFDEYRARKKTDRNAIWKIPARLNKQNRPEVGTITYPGLPVEEANLLNQNLNDQAKNMVGINPQRQEIQKNTGVRQTMITEEKEIEAIQAIVEKNIPNFMAMYKMFLAFCIAHEGFGMDDVEVKFTKYFDENVKDENGEPITFEDGIEASISISGLVEKIKDFEYNVLIDKSSMIKRSRVLEQETILKGIQLVDPQTMPQVFLTLMNRFLDTLGLPKQEVDAAEIAQSKPQGGLSQFQGGGEPTADTGQNKPELSTDLNTE